ncbi:nitrite transporter NirC [Robbsia andropogonis]|uniref:Nitrite transporter NirC n=1 Tax=Robbsia andropogonis TaxID=28092 RepID=A0A0F5JZY5_9BURK|nr:formate/nitrite transporter family protein [Robbsia andropogonis]KKB63169.1 nitrite transporter NirC [Robbsia andropogonis]MCP1117573.1 formate/nitrite transporter family protein [Robbsia andropogonis]MCP1127039.1 formate/nitrite transporter family protein [Robbsia andropogonis]
MYAETIDKFAKTGADKVALIARNPLAYLIGAAMAGVYIGFGDILMFSVGVHVDPAYVHLVMGGVFACALTFCVFAGSELFTGTAMYMPIAMLRRQASLGGVLAVWMVCWIGNLVGAVLLAAILHTAGGGVLLTDGATGFYKAVTLKMSAPGSVLFAKGVLCNWLVCLAVWMAARTSSDAAKLGVIFWAIFAFVASGFEHSVANMFIFALALMGDHPIDVTLGGAIHNELFVTLGNLVGGAIFMGAGYWLQDIRQVASASQSDNAKTVAQSGGNVR